jgi:REP element-mobilizing transposase RayT
MPRKPRIEFPDAIHHVTIRGVNRSPVFRDDADNWAFVDFLRSSCERHDWRVIAYCLMVNHAHLVISTPAAKLGAGMQWLTANYARRSHSRYRTTGHVFQGRYHSMLVKRDPYLLEVVRYVLLNPVRARLCHTATDWRWSSAREVLGLRPTPDWADFSVLFGLLSEGGSNPKARVAGFLEGSDPALSPRRGQSGV